jgi:hypothetical protein
MKRDEPEVIDLIKHRKAVEARQAAAKAAREKAAKAARKAPGRGSESLLGGRRHAGLILLAFALVILAIYVLPRFL